MKAIRPGPRPGGAPLLIATTLFAMIFIAGIGYLLFQNQADRVSYQSNMQALQDQRMSGQEQIAFCAIPQSAGSCLAKPSGSALSVIVNDTGGIPVSVTGWFVKNATTGLMVSSGVVQLVTPVTLDVGISMTFPLTGNSYTNGTDNVSLLTSRGNVFTQQYPLSTSVTTMVQSSTTVTVTGQGNGGGNSLIVVMAATPVQAFTGAVITDNVTLFNYSNVPMTLASPPLLPDPPSYTTTGTAKLVPTGCAGPFTPPGQVPDVTNTIPAYGGSGTAPHVYFLCTYTASSGAVGGLASFSGAAEAIVTTTSGNVNVFSSQVTSNLVQIGGLTNPIAQGAFTSNFFFFKYSSCIQPTGANFVSPCIPNFTPPANVNNFMSTAAMSAGSNRFVAFYLSITNTYSTTLPILQYTFEQFDSSSGNESDWWIAGTNTSMTGGVYYPTYPASGNPTLISYPTDCANVYATAVPGHPANSPKDPACIYVNPGQTVTITLASCGPGVNVWDWGGSRYGAHFDTTPSPGGAACTSSTPYLNDNGGTVGSATAAITVISFEYNGQVYTQDISFQGVAFTG